MSAIEALQRIVFHNSSPLLAVLKSPNPRVRAGVVEALGQLPGAPPRISEATRDSSARVRLAALLSLAKLDANTKLAIPQIRRLLKDDSRPIRETATSALREIEQGLPSR